MNPEDDDFDFLVLPGQFIEKLPIRSVDMFINTRSMMEMNLETVSYYFEHMHRQLRPGGAFYCINRYEKKTRLKDYPFDENWYVSYSSPWPSYIDQNPHHELIRPDRAPRSTRSPGAGSVLAAHRKTVLGPALRTFVMNPRTSDRFRLPKISTGLWLDLALGIVLTDLVLIVTSGGFSILGRTEMGGFFFRMVLAIAFLGLRHFRNRSGMIPSRTGLWILFLVMMAQLHFLGHRLRGDSLSTTCDGFSDPYLHAVALGNLLIGWAGLWFLDELLRKWFSPAVSFLASVAKTGLASVVIDRRRKWVTGESSSSDGGGSASICWSSFELKAGAGSPSP